MKYLGLFLVLLSWAAGIYMLRKWNDQRRSTSISRNAASNSGDLRLFAIVLIGIGSFFYTWLVWWFIPALDLSIVFLVLVTITFLTQIIAGIIPASEGLKSIIHKAAAFGGAFLYIPLSILIITASKISSGGKTIGILCLAYMLVACVSFFLVKKARSRYVIFQALYIMAFQIIILGAAYIR